MIGKRLAHTLPVALFVAALVALLLIARPAIASPLPQEGYPPPTPSTEQESPNEPLTPLPTPIAPYPQPEAPSLLATPNPIGAQNGISNGQIVTEGVAEPGSVQQGDSRNLLYLWAGFLGTLLIFIGCVVGASMLFTRRNET
jgi:hypothetical protein